MRENKKSKITEKEHTRGKLKKKFMSIKKMNEPNRTNEKKEIRVLMVVY